MAAGSDWLYEVGVDSAGALSDLDDFVSQATAKLNALKAITLTVDTTAAKTALTDFASMANQTVSDSIKPVNIRISTAGAARSLRTFLANFQKERSALDGVGTTLERVNAQFKFHADVLAAQASAFERATGVMRAGAQELTSYANAQTAAFESIANASRTKNSELSAQAKLNNADAEAARQNRIAHEAFRTSIGGVTTTLKSNGDMLDFVGRVAHRTMFNYLEYEVVMQGFNAVMHEVTNSLHQASNVDFEEKMQRLYNPAVFNGIQATNQALKNAIAIAREWGSDISDVQQSIGLWTKQTSDLAAATFLADKAEQMHAASGIESMEVIRDSIALVNQLGIKYKDLGGIYDQVAKAATLVDEPLRRLGKGSGEEGVRDIFQGLSRDAAELRHVGFTATEAIAATTVQVQALAQQGHEAGQSLATMLGALQQGGKSRGVFENIMTNGGRDKDVFSNGEKFMQSLLANVDKLRQAQANGQLHVKPFSDETFQTLLNQVKEIEQISKKLQDESNGALQKIATGYMESFQGKLDQAKTAVQAFSITLGEKLLPQATRFMDWFIQSEPSIEHFTGDLVQLVKVAGELGAGLLIFQGYRRAAVFVQELAAAERLAMDAGFRSAEEMRAEQVAASEYAVASERAAAAQNLLASAEARRAGIAAAGAKASTTAAEAETFEGRAAGAAAGEVGALGVAEGSVAAGAAGISRATGAIAVVRNLGLSALTAASRFALFAAGVYAASKAVDGFDRDKALDNAIQGQKDENASWSDLGAWARMPGHVFTDIGATVAGNGSVYDDYVKHVAGLNSNVGRQVNTIEREKTVYQQMRTQLLDSDGHLIPGAGNGQRRAFADQQIAALNQRELALVSSAHTWELQHPGMQQSGEYRELEKWFAEERKRDAAFERALNQRAGNSDDKHYFYNGPQKKTKTSGPQSLFADAVDKVKRDSQAAMNSQLELANAAEKTIKSIEQEGKQSGYTADGLKRLNKASAEQVSGLRGAENAAKGEILKLVAQQAAGERLLPTLKKNSDAYRNVKKHLDEISAAMVKANAAMRDHALAARNATQNDFYVRARYTANLAVQPFGGLTGIQRDIETRGSALENLPDEKKSPAMILLTALTSSQGLQADIARLTAPLSHLQSEGLGKGETAKSFSDQIDRASEDLKKLAKASQEATKALTEDARKQEDSNNSLAVDTVKALGGIDETNFTTADANYVAQMVELQQKVADEAAKTNEQLTQLLTVQKDASFAKLPPAQQQAILAEITALQRTQNLLPSYYDAESRNYTEAYRKQQTQNTYLYGAANSAFGVFNTNAGEGIAKLLNPHNSSSMFDQSFSGFATNFFDSIFSNGKNNFMQGLFGFNPYASSDPADKDLQAATTQLNSSNIFKASVQAYVASTDKLSTAIDKASGGDDDDNQAKPHDVNIQSVGGTSVSQNGTPMSVNVQQVDGQQVSTAASPSGSTGISGGGIGSVGTASSFMNSTAGLSSALKGFSSGGSAGSASGIAGLLQSLEGGGGTDSGLSQLGMVGAGSGILSSIGRSVGGGVGGGVFGALGAGIGLNMLLGGGAGLTGTGGLFAMMAANPLLFGGVMLAAGVLGSGIIGPHWGPSSNYPDRSDTQQYGQFYANYNGYNINANGTLFNPSSQYATDLGNQSEWQQVEQWLNNPQSLANMSGTALNQMLALKAMFDSGNGDMQITGEKNGVFSFANGSTDSVSSFMSLMNQAAGYMGSNQSVAPIMSFNAMGAGANYMASPYNIPGATSSMLQAWQAANWVGYTSPGYYGTPSSVTGNSTRTDQIVGTNNGTATTNANGTTTINLVVDGAILAQTVLNFEAGLNGRQLTMA
jgi:hypothetical protein